MYRSFRPPNLVSPELFFTEELNIIGSALCANCYVLGDFNLDANMCNRLDYARRVPLKELTDFALNNNLDQIVTFNTWPQNINGIRKESSLDHAYVNNPATIGEISFITPTFGDHVLVLVKLNLIIDPTVEMSQKRNWKGYSATKISTMLSTALSNCGADWDILNVQDHWNCLETIIIDCIDDCAPIIYVASCDEAKPKNVPIHVKTKLNTRKRLLKLDRLRSSTVNAPRIKDLNKEITTILYIARDYSILL